MRNRLRRKIDAIPTRSVTAWEPFQLKCSGRMNRPCAKLLAIGKQLQPREQARNRLRRKIDARFAQGVNFAVHAAEIYGLDFISPPAAAKLCEASISPAGIFPAGLDFLVKL